MNIFLSDDETYTPKHSKQYSSNNSSNYAFKVPSNPTITMNLRAISENGIEEIEYERKPEHNNLKVNVEVEHRNFV